MFVPRVRVIVEQGAALPSGSNIKPYAEEALKVEKLEMDKMLELIEQFDRLMA